MPNGANGGPSRTAGRAPRRRRGRGRRAAWRGRRPPSRRRHRQPGRRSHTQRRRPEGEPVEPPVVVTVQPDVRGRAATCGVRCERPRGGVEHDAAEPARQERRGDVGGALRLGAEAVEPGRAGARGRRAVRTRVQRSPPGAPARRVQYGSAASRRPSVRRGRRHRRAARSSSAAVMSSSTTRRRRRRRTPSGCRPRPRRRPGRRPASATAGSPRTSRAPSRTSTNSRSPSTRSRFSGDSSIEPYSSTSTAACCGGVWKPSSERRIVPRTPESRALLRALIVYAVGGALHLGGGRGVDERRRARRAGRRSSPRSRRCTPPPAIRVEHGAVGPQRRAPVLERRRAAVADRRVAGVARRHDQHRCDLAASRRTPAPRRSGRTGRRSGPARRPRAARGWGRTGTPDRRGRRDRARRPGSGRRGRTTRRRRRRSGRCRCPRALR